MLDAPVVHHQGQVQDPEGVPKLKRMVEKRVRLQTVGIFQVQQGLQVIGPLYLTLSIQMHNPKLKGKRS